MHEIRSDFLPTVRQSFLHPVAFARNFPNGQIKPALFYCLIVQATSIVATVVVSLALQGSATSPIDVVVRESEKALWLIGISLLLAVSIHTIAHRTGSNSRLSDAIRIVAYALAAYSVLRLAVLPLFLLKLEQTKVGGTLAFVLWAGPIVFSAWFTLIAIRHRYQRSFAMASLAIGVPLMLFMVIVAAWSALR